MILTAPCSALQGHWGPLEVLSRMRLDTSKQRLEHAQMALLAAERGGVGAADAASGAAAAAVTQRHAAAAAMRI